MMLKECQRVLKTGGFYVCVSFGQPNTREKHFLRPHLKFAMKTIRIETVGHKGPADNDEETSEEEEDLYS